MKKLLLITFCLSAISALAASTEVRFQTNAFNHAASGVGVRVDAGSTVGDTIAAATNNPAQTWDSELASYLALTETNAFAASLKAYSDAGTNAAVTMATNNAWTATQAATNGTVAGAATLVNANLPIPTNTPSAGQVPTATSETTSEWATPTASGVTPVYGLGRLLTVMGSNTVWELGESVLVMENFRGNALDTRMQYNGGSGGNGAMTVGLTGQSGAVKLYAVPTNTSSYGICKLGWASSWKSNLLYDVSFQLSGIEQMEFSFGISSAVNANEPTARVAWLLNTNWSPNFIAQCMAASSSTYWTSTLAVAESTPYRLTIYAPSTNTVYFYTNGVQATSIGDNVPGGSSLNLATRVRSESAAGSSNQQNLYLDWLSILMQ